jgi:hypothetical protein
MGRIDVLGYKLDGINPGYSPLDLFHYTSPGVHTYTGTTPNYFSVDGGQTNLDYFNSNPAGDLGDWAASAGADSYLAFSPLGQANTVSQADITAMNALGYQTVPFGTVMEAFGSTELVLSHNAYFLEPVGGGAGPSLKYGGTVITASAGGWSPIGAEWIGGSYDVAWKESGQDLYSVWNADSNGNYLSNAVSSVAGNNAALESIETTFHQDLNGDSVIGIPPSTTIESSGSTSLVLQGSDYFLDPVSGGTGPTVKYGGTVVVASAGGWSPIGAEAISSGYEIAWKESGQDLYSVWNADTNGNYVSNAISSVSGSSPAFEAIETSFQQDLNGDGTIGLPAGVIESSGSTSLVLSGANYFLDPVSGGTGPTVKYGGTAIVAGGGNWSPIGAEAISGGYEIAWKLAGQDAYIAWNLDTNGNFASGNPMGEVTASSTALESLETSFHQDLNGDGTIGIPSNATIEAFGSLSLVLTGDHYFLDPVSGGTGPTLKYGGTTIVAGASTWSPIGADVYTPQAYEVAWKLAGQDSYMVWIVDHNGNFIAANPIGQVPGSNVGLESLEPSFHQDLNSDGTIGVPGSGSSTIEGSATLVNAGNVHTDVIASAPLIGLAVPALPHDIS